MSLETDNHWIFRKKDPREKLRDPVLAEFFKSEVVGDSCSSLIREAIQNSLDAKLDPGKPVIVRITLSGNEKAIDCEQANCWFEGLYPHINAREINLPNPPHPDEPCPVLIFEDFNTTGLNGCVHQHASSAGSENPFFHFFRAEGRSEKAERKLGRWGLGKYVFPGASRGRTFFGLTIPSDHSRTLLMGQTVLKFHKCEGEDYSPDGNWGTINPDGPDLPCDDNSVISQFRRDFLVTRHEEPGLSIIIPWYDTENVTISNLTKAVIKDYFWPLLQSSLRVEIHSPELSETIDHEWVERLLEKPTATDLDLGLIELALWASRYDSEDYTRLNSVFPENNTWSANSFPPDQLELLADRYNSGEKLAFHVPISIQPKNRQEEQGSFKVYLWKKQTTSAAKPVFIRNGIIIRDAGTRILRGCTAIVVADDGPCASMLGDAENPAHTKWEHATERFKTRYQYPHLHIKAVTDSASSIHDLLSGAVARENKLLLLDFFSLSGDAGEGLGHTGKGPQKGRKSPEVVVPPLPRHKRYRVEKREGGFSVTRGDAESRTPVLIDVRMAYDAIGYSASKAIKSYTIHDFSITSRAFDIVVSDLEISLRKENRLLLKVLGPEFRMDVDGFDSNRDIVVSVNALDEDLDSI